MISHHGWTDNDVAQILACCPADFIGGFIATKPPVEKKEETKKRLIIGLTYVGSETHLFYKEDHRETVCLSREKLCTRHLQTIQPQGLNIQEGNKDSHRSDTYFCLFTQ